MGKLHREPRWCNHVSNALWCGPAARADRLRFGVGAQGAVASGRGLQMIGPLRICGCMVGCVSRVSGCKEYDWLPLDRRSGAANVEMSSAPFIKDVN